MSDILVRVPKSEVEHFWEEIPDGNIAWWTLARVPKNFKPGERLFFQIGEDVVAYAVAHEIQQDARTCEDTGRVWKGCHVVWPKGALTKLEEPVPGRKLTRGFCYFSYTKEGV